MDIIDFEIQIKHKGINEILFVNFEYTTIVEDDHRLEYSSVDLPEPPESLVISNIHISEIFDVEKEIYYTDELSERVEDLLLTKYHDKIINSK